MRVSRILAAGALDGVGVAASRGGDAAEMLQQVQNQPLATEQYARVMADGCDGRALAETHAIENLLRNAYLGIGARLALKLGKHFKYALHRGDAGQHAILFRQDGRRCFLLRIDGCQGGCVAGGLILQQRV